MLNDRLSIAHVTEAFAGGVTTYMMHVLPALAARGHQVSLYCCDGRNEPTFADAIQAMSNSGVTIKMLPMRRTLVPWADARAVLRLRQEFKNGHYDLVHTHGTKAGLLGRLAARLAGVSAVHTPHCYAFLRAGMQLRAFAICMTERAMANSTPGLVAVCESERRAAIKHGLIDPVRCAVVHNGLPTIDAESLDRGQVRREFGLPQSSLVITMAARLVDYKGIGLFLDVAELCGDTGAIFILAGYGELEDWAKGQIVRRGLSDRVRMPGHVKDVPTLLAASDLCVLCSRAEGQPYVLLEAMRGGCPILAPQVPGIQDMLEHGKTALLVRRHADAFAAGIRQLAGDKALRRSLAVRAKERFIEAHQLEQQIDALIETYERFCGNHK